MTFRITYMEAPGVGMVYSRLDVIRSPDGPAVPAGVITLKKEDFELFRTAFKDVKSVVFVPHTWEEIRKNQPLAS